MAEPYPWQTAVWQHLGRLEVAARLPHAIFFVGSPGLGKREFARLFAHRLLCESPDPDARPCCACRACRLFTSGLHPDFHEVGLEGKHSVIRVDQIRALIEFVTLTSQQSGRKIACVQDAERMNPSAANSFLKTLEEPPDDTLLLLASDSAQRLPATIRSRCQLIRFSKPNRATGLRWLADQGVTESGELLLDLADNAPLRARALADGSGLARRQALFEQFASPSRVDTRSAAPERGAYPDGVSEQRSGSGTAKDFKRAVSGRPVWPVESNRENAPAFRNFCIETARLRGPPDRLDAGGDDAGRARGQLRCR